MNIDVIIFVIVVGFVAYGIGWNKHAKMVKQYEDEVKAGKVIGTKEYNER